MVSSSSYRRNIQLLQRYYTALKAQGAQLGVSFSIPETELVHLRKKCDRAPVSHSPIHLDGSIPPPNDEVPWLGHWFTPSISTTPPFTKSPAKAQAAFVTIKQLSPRGWVCPRFCATSWSPHFSSPSSATVRIPSNLPRIWREDSLPSGTRSKGGPQTASLVHPLTSWLSKPASLYSVSSSHTNTAWLALGC